MRVLFLSPPVLPAGSVSPPLAIATLVAWVAPDCETVRVFDGDLLFFRPERRSRASLQAAFHTEVEALQPDVLLVTSMYNNSALAAGLIKAAKAQAPGMTIVGGGPHFGAQAEEALKGIPDLDFVIVGEGEVGLKSLLGALQGAGGLQATPNLAWRSKSKVVVNPRAHLLDLTQLPNVWAASADAVDLAAYAATIAADSPHRALYIEAGRGCPFSCHFCAPAQFWDRRYRVKSSAQIAAEIAYLYDEFRYDAFILVHDLLTVDPRFVRELSRAIRSLDRPVRWMANSRTDLAQARNFEELVDSGCWRLFYGIDSGSRRVQQSINKNLDPDEALEVIARAAGHGLGTICSFVVGHLDESDAELSESLLLGVRMKLVGAENVQFHRLRLFPPAPIASGEQLGELLAASSLDDTTLRLEYPLRDISREERAFIEDNPRFYAGYFPPTSPSGTAEEISQIELFFTQGVAFAPLTVFALGRLPLCNLVQQFREHLARHKLIDRYAFDPSELNVVRNWSVLKHRLELMIEDADVSGDDKALLCGLLAYEDSRMRFVHRQDRSDNALVWQESEAIIRARVGVDLVMQAAVTGAAPDSSMIEELTIIFRREGNQVMLVR